MTQPENTWCGLKTVLLLVSNGMSQGLGWWGKFVAHRPRLVLFLSIVVCCGLLPGWYLVNNRFVTDTQKLWVPQGSKAIKDREFLQPLFHDVGGKSGNVYITSPLGDVLDSQVLATVFNIHNTVLGLNITVDGKQLAYNDVCRKKALVTPSDGPRCSFFGILGFWDYNQSAFNQSVLSTTNSRERIMTEINVSKFPDNSEVLLDQVFANAKYQVQSDGQAKTVRLLAAGATRMIYQLDSSLSDDVVKEWSDQFETLMKTTTSNLKSTVTIDFYHPYSIDKEATKGGFGNAPLIAASTIIISLLGLVVLSKWNFVKTRGFLSTLGFLTVVLSVFTGYAISFYLQLNMSFLNTFALPFILLGIGMDNMYVLVFGLEEINQEPSSIDGTWQLPDKFERLLAHSGTSLAATTACNVLAFMLGSLSALPAITWFCQYAAICVACCFFLFLSFFLACFVLNEHRIQQGFFDVPLCCCRPYSSSTRPAPLRQETLASPTTLRAQLMSSVVDTSTKHEQARSPSTRLPKCPFPSDAKAQEMRRAASVQHNVMSTMIEDDRHTQEKVEQKREGVADAFTYVINRWVGETYPRGLLTPLGKITVILCALGLLGASIYGAFHLKEGLPLTDLVPRQSYVHGFFQKQERVWEYQSGEMSNLYLCNLDLADPAVQDKASSAYETLFKEGSYFNRSQTPSTTWLKAFHEFGVRYDNTSNTSFTTNGRVRQDRFYELLPIFLEKAPNFRADVNVTSGGKIQCSRFPATHRPRRGENAFTRKALEYVRAREHDLNSKGYWGAAVTTKVATIYMEAYEYWEQDKGLKDTLLKSLLLDFAGVAAVSLVMLVHPMVAVIMVVGVIVTNVYLMGMMWALGLRLNTVSSVNLVMAVGLSVDYMMHISHKFISVAGADLNSRVASAMRDMGTPIFLGALTVLCGVLPIAGSNSNMIRYFCYLMVGTVVFGILVGLSLIPVLLSWFGPKQLLHIETETCSSQPSMELRTSLSRIDGPPAAGRVYSQPSSVHRGV